MKRLLLNLLALFSFLLFMATLSLWGRSYIAGDQIFWDRVESVPGRYYWIYHHVLICRGSIGVNRLLQSSSGDWSTVRKNTLPFHSSMKPSYPDFKFGPTTKTFGGDFGHFAYYDNFSSRARAEGHLVIIPFWWLAIFFALTGGPFWFYWYRARRAPKEGLCPHCGYDLRASPDRCPECGHTRNASLPAT